MLRPRGITSQGGIVHYKSPAFNLNQIESSMKIEKCKNSYRLFQNSVTAIEKEWWPCRVDTDELIRPDYEEDRNLWEGMYCLIHSCR